MSLRTLRWHRAGRGFPRRERRRKGAIVLVVGGEAAGLARLSLGIEIEQVCRYVAHLLTGAALRLGPLIRAQLVQRRIIRCGTRIAADQMQRSHRHIDAITARVLDDQELAVLFCNLHGLQAHIPADAVFLVHHRCAGRQIRQIAQDRSRIKLAATPPAFLLRMTARTSRHRQAAAGRGLLQESPPTSGAVVNATRAPGIQEGLPAGHCIEDYSRARAAGPAAAPFVQASRRRSACAPGSPPAFQPAAPAEFPRAHPVTIAAPASATARPRRCGTRSAAGWSALRAGLAGSRNSSAGSSTGCSMS